jgi:hypothetical protein
MSSKGCPEDIQGIKTRYRGVIPDHVIDSVPDDVADQDAIPDASDLHIGMATFFWGIDPNSRNLVVAPSGLVEGMAEGSARKAASRTWGQYRMLGGRVPTEHAGWEFASPGEFLEHAMIADPGKSLDQVWAEYRALGALWGRPPLDDDPYDRADHETWELERGSPPLDLLGEMADTLPQEILREFAEVEGGGMIGGSWVTLDADRRDELIAALTARGETVVEDQELIAAAQNQVGDPAAVFRRCRRSVFIDAYLEEVSEALYEANRPEPPDDSWMDEMW